MAEEESLSPLLPVTNSSKGKALSSGTSEGSGATRPSNPFETTNLKTYNHKPNIVPPYVLDTLSKVHYKDQLNNSNVNNQQTDTDPSVKLNHNSTTSSNNKKEEDDYLSFSNDPFVKSMNSNWHNFLHSIKQPNTYTKDLVTFDKDTVFQNKLDGSWGGEERLKLALLGTPSSDEDTYVNEKTGGWFPRFTSRSTAKLDRQVDDSPRVRSKAGYWMSTEKRADVLPFLKRIFVINPLVPLLLRICIIFFSVCALALAATIWNYSDRKYEGTKIQQQPSTIMAIVIQCIAIVYLIYIAYDEYSGKPLGLRDPLGKMKLIMLDLLFIIFSSANLSLAFNTLYDDQWVCQSGPDDGSPNYVPAVSSICRRQRLLAAFLFLVLNLWVLTFTISLVRVVDRVSVAPRTD